MVFVPSRLTINYCVSLKLFFSIKIVDVQNEYKEYLLRVPVLIKNEEVLVEGVFSRLSIVKNLFF